MIASDDHDRRVGFGDNAREKTVELTHGGFRRRGAIKDITGDDEDVGGMLGDALEDLIEDSAVILLERAPLELPAKVPIGRMQNLHISPLSMHLVSRWTSRAVKIRCLDMNKNESLRHGVLERQRFIDAHLFWESRINRADLIAAYSVSPAQAALDFREYLKRACRGVVYDTKSKAYVTTAAFAPAFGLPEASKFLADLSALGDPWTFTLPKLERPLDPVVVARVRHAARNRERLRIDYQSFTKPEPARRWIAPARLISDGERWHARCWCYENGEWRDFVLARISSIRASEPAANLPPDRDWDETVDLILKPAAELSKGQKATVIREYAMKAGQLVTTIPRAMRLYAIRRWGLDRPTTRMQIF